MQSTRVPLQAGRSLGARSSRLRALSALLGTLLLTLAFGGTAAHGETPGPSVPAPGSGGIGLRLLDVPATTKDDPRATLYVVDHLAPGQVVKRRVQVSNTTSAPVHIALYSAAASIKGGVFVGAEGHTRNELSTWTSLGPERLAVPAGGDAVTTVTIAVPADAAPGETYAAVWAEARSSASAQGVTQVSRVGLRLYISVGPGGAPAPGFTIDSLTAERSAEGLPVVVASVHNTGGRALDMSGSLSLLGGPGGLNAGPYPATLGTTLAVRDTETVRVALDSRVPPGPWSAEITLRSGLLERTEKATLTFPQSGSSAPVSTARGWPRWAGATLGALVVVLGLAVALLTRRRLAQRRAR